MKSHPTTLKASTGEIIKSTYTQPVLTYYGEVAKLTSSGSKQVQESSLNPKGTRND